MYLLRIFIIGSFFGVVLTKAEVISWFRIQEMFLFDSFHMYGIIGTAILVAMILIQVIKRFNIKSIDNEEIKITPKITNVKALIFGGTIFGLGWALTGACPGPLYADIGNGYSVAIVSIFSAIIGTFSYSVLKPKLAH